MKDAKPDTLPVRIIKTNTCPSLSGKSTITYQIGIYGQSDIVMRVEANSATGYFNKDWVHYAEIEKVLANYPKITSFALRSVYSGKSTNSPGFLLAAIKSEGLVQLAGEKERYYLPVNPDQFLTEVKTLMAGNPDTGEIPPAAAIKKSKSPK